MEMVQEMIAVERESVVERVQRAGLQGEAGHAQSNSRSSTCQMGTPLSQHVALIKQDQPKKEKDGHSAHGPLVSPLSLCLPGPVANDPRRERTKHRV